MSAMFRYRVLKKAKVLLLALALSASQLHAQLPPAEQFDVYRKEAVQEKIFLHTDKDFYLAGEICWFKLYDVDASFHRPLDLSKLAYVEILDKNNKQVLQAKIALKNGDGNGSLYLPPSLESGKYRLRSYTNWMKNFSANYFFEKNITIINSRKVYEADTAKKKEEYSIQFFPEGGNLVNGIQSKIAFRIVDQDGKGVPCEGIVVDQKQDTLMKFSTLKFGIGSFDFTPAAGNTYTSLISLPNGKKILQALPVAYANGYVMHLQPSGSNEIKISVTSAGASSAVYLFAHTRNSIRATMRAEMQNGMATFIIDKNKLGDGISHFTLFNENRQPVCERLYFKYPSASLELTIHPAANSYELRNKINLQVSAADNNGKPLGANMSMAVYRLDGLQGIDDMDINNYLWLSSDLAGTVESPSFYFTNINEATIEAMDNLMLTHGWRRFKWEDILGGKKPVFEFSPEFVGHFVTGRITKTGTAIPGREIGAYLSIPGTKTQFHNTVSDANGRVKFEIKDFYNDGEIIVQANNMKDSGYSIDIANPFSGAYSEKILTPFRLPAENITALAERNLSMQVENAYNSLQQKQFGAPAIDTSTFYLKPDVSYLLDNYVRFTTLEEVLREYVKPVNVKRKNGVFYFPVYDENQKDFFDADPLLLLDGVPVFDKNKFMNYDPLQVRKLEVVSRMYYLGDMFYPGIVNFITYNGNLAGFEFDPHTTILDYDGLQLQREFYSPVYDTKQQADSKLPDFRNLLYWSPNIKTTTSGKQDISFYSSDLPGKYAVVLQGITADGKTGATTMQFEIKEPVTVTHK